MEPARGAAKAEAIIVYLVASDARADALVRSHADSGLLPNEMVLVADSPEQRARARAVLKSLILEIGDAKVRIVDLRRTRERPATPATWESGCGLDTLTSAC